MAYLDNIDKVRGKEREPIIAKKLMNYFREEMNLNVTCRKSSDFEDKNYKYDYEYTCDESQSFSRDKRVTSVKIDIKSGDSLTLINRNGRNNLEKSESDFIVYEIKEDDNMLLAINTKSLKKCLEERYPILRESKWEDGSQYFFIKNYVEENEDILKYNWMYLNI